MPQTFPHTLPTHGELAFQAWPSDVSASLGLAGRRATNPWDQVLGSAQRLARWRIGATLALRAGPSVLQQEVAQACHHALDQTQDLTVRPHLLVQPAELGFDRGLLSELLRHAQERRTVLLFDHVRLDQADAAMACLMDLQEQHHEHLGLSLLASRARSASDAKRAIAWGLRLRLEHDWPSFDRPGAAARPLLRLPAGIPSDRPTRAQVADGFLALAQQLVQGAPNGRGCAVSLITHEPALAEQALARLTQGGVRGTLELRPDQPRQGVLYIARQRGVAVRSQLAWGEAAPTADDSAARDPRSRWWGALRNGLDTLLPGA